MRDIVRHLKSHDRKQKALTRQLARVSKNMDELREKEQLVAEEQAMRKAAREHRAVSATNDGQNCDRTASQSS